MHYVSVYHLTQYYNKNVDVVQFHFDRTFSIFNLHIIVSIIRSGNDLVKKVKISVIISRDAAFSDRICARQKIHRHRMTVWLGPLST